MTHTLKESPGNQSWVVDDLTLNPEWWMTLISQRRSPTSRRGFFTKTKDEVSGNSHLSLPYSVNDLSRL